MPTSSGGTFSSRRNYLPLGIAKGEAYTFRGGKSIPQKAKLPDPKGNGSYIFMSHKSLSVDNKSELRIKNGCGFTAEDHSFEEDLKIFGNRTHIGVYLQRKLDHRVVTRYNVDLTFKHRVVYSVVDIEG